MLEFHKIPLVLFSQHGSRSYHYRLHPKDGEGNVFSLSTPRGGYPYPIMLCNITQNAMGQTPRGVPISHNALQHYPEFDGADTWGVPCQGGTLLRGGTLPRSYPARGYPAGGYPAGGYPVRTTEGVFTTRRAVCLLRSRRRIFLFCEYF